MSETARQTVFVVAEGYAYEGYGEPSHVFARHEDAQAFVAAQPESPYSWWSIFEHTVLTRAITE